MLLISVRIVGGLVNHTASYCSYPPKTPGYMYVNAEEPNTSFKGMTDRAAQTLFWTELARGFAVTLAHIFKVSILITSFLI